MKRVPLQTVTLPILIPAANRTDGHATWEEGSRPVQELRLNDLRPLLESLDPRGVHRWAGLVTLRDAVRSSDELLFEKAASSARRGEAAIVLSQLMSKEISRARIVLWYARKMVLLRDMSGSKPFVPPPDKLIPAIYCEDVKTALFVFAAIGRGLSICPRCDKTFVQKQKRRHQQYCSIRCREAHRVERWRKRQRTK